MNGKCEIHRNQAYPVSGNQKRDERTNGHEDPYITPTLVKRGYKNT